MVNKVILIGNVGADPEVRYLEGGVAVANLRLATTERYKNKSGENRRALWPRTITHRNRPTRIILKILRRTRARTAPRKALLTARTRTISK